MTTEGLSLEEYLKWLDSLSVADRARNFYKKSTDITDDEIESMISSLSEAELEEQYQRERRLLQDKEAFMRGDKSHKYSRYCLPLLEIWEQEKKMKDLIG
ncbi:hypothetical protein [Paenibacillus sp. FSL R5-808]|jgi:hypothetical protein|uniref:hypothetical protein n=1 Tax=Paenibacillus sp. FSL R5-808 TaxID=1227076 RepID=UPI0003E20B64|nr:hypothetical protein [Paenibacillus sp. FSL R5-808]ETT38505.1 hypothetical protein C169_12872 [Paenibacillus sp. FSL R5-808]